MRSKVTAVPGCRAGVAGEGGEAVEQLLDGARFPAIGLVARGHLGPGRGGANRGRHRVLALLGYSLDSAWNSIAHAVSGARYLMVAVVVAVAAVLGLLHWRCGELVRRTDRATGHLSALARIQARTYAASLAAQGEPGEEGEAERRSLERPAVGLILAGTEVQGARRCQQARAGRAGG